MISWAERKSGTGREELRERNDVSEGTRWTNDTGRRASSGGQCFRTFIQEVVALSLLTVLIVK